jgi:UDP-2,3-diacylglucosamine pyrophosphatase LpxH
VNGKRAWFFHGDVFDAVIQNSKWLARLGAVGYDSLILLNEMINRINSLLGRGKVSLSKKIKENVKKAVSYINNFEETAATLAAKKGFSYIVCGHIHHPGIRTIRTTSGEIGYLNSGDWIENLTSLEYENDQWSLYHFSQDPRLQESLKVSDKEQTVTDMNNKQVFRILLEEFYQTP